MHDELSELRPKNGTTDDGDECGDEMPERGSERDADWVLRGAEGDGS